MVKTPGKKSKNHKKVQKNLYLSSLFQEFIKIWTQATWGKHVWHLARKHANFLTVNVLLYDVYKAKPASLLNHGELSDTTLHIFAHLLCINRPTEHFSSYITWPLTAQGPHEPHLWPQEQSLPALSVSSWSTSGWSSLSSSSHSITTVHTGVAPRPLPHTQTSLPSISPRCPPSLNTSAWKSQDHIKLTIFKVGPSRSLLLHNWVMLIRSGNLSPIPESVPS